MSTMDILLQMLAEIEEHKKMDKKAMLEECVARRLNKSLKTYYDSLNQSASYLQRINNPTRQKKILRDTDGHKEE